MLQPRFRRKSNKKKKKKILSNQTRQKSNFAKKLHFFPQEIFVGFVRLQNTFFPDMMPLSEMTILLERMHIP